MSRIIVAAIAAALLLTSGIAAACSCRAWSSAAEQAADADVIFRGRALRSVPVPGALDGMVATTFELVAALKMPPGYEETPPHRLEIRHDTTGGGMCGIVYASGAETLIIAHIADDRQLYTGACSASRWPEGEYRRALGLDD